MLTSLLFAVLFAVCNADQFTATVDVGKITGNVSKWVWHSMQSVVRPQHHDTTLSLFQIFGMNMYQPYGHNDEYTGNYTMGRMGGNAQTRFNYKINAHNAGHDYYFINSQNEFTWQQMYSAASKSGLAFWTQIPAMGMTE